MWAGTTGRYYSYQLKVAASKIGMPENRLHVHEQKSPEKRFQSAEIYLYLSCDC